MRWGLEILVLDAPIARGKPLNNSFTSSLKVIAIYTLVENAKNGSGRVLFD